ncbi:hypothetical protein SOVF_120790 [Spinacia oleracea]|nr:hypothetical protein SOVF_120790 [Spinacia oleracea]
MDLNMMMKRGKLAGKALGNIMFHLDNHLFASQGGGGVGGGHEEYEFSCSNTPSYRHYFTNKRKNHRQQNNINNKDQCFYMPSPLQGGENNVSLEDVNNVLEMMLRNEETIGGGFSAAASPAFPGRSPAVRQLRITDSPFPVRDMDQNNNNKHVDQAAEDFIKNFYSQLRQQK